jgi:hypothetical protein
LEAAHQKDFKENDEKKQAELDAYRKKHVERHKKERKKERNEKEMVFYF